MRTVLVLFLVLISTPGLFAQSKGHVGGPGYNFRQKADSKGAQRWTLQEWLEQKDRNRLMDLWLGMYAPSPYEFFISGSYLSYDAKSSSTTAPGVETSQSFSSYSGSVGAYALVMGVEAHYENNVKESYNDLSGSLNLRVLGNAVQGTHLIIFYGMRTRNMPNTITLRQQFAGADLDLYLMKYFGLHGNYRQFLPTSDSTLGDVSGSRTEAGLFIDFEAVRLFGNWYTEKQESNLTGTINNQDRTGISSGIKFFF